MFIIFFFSFLLRNTEKKQMLANTTLDERDGATRPTFKVYIAVNI